MKLIEKCPDIADWLVNKEDGELSYGSKNKIDLKCIKCESIFKSSVNDVSSGSRCPYCCIAPRKVNETNWVYGNIEMMSCTKDKDILKKYTVGSNQKNTWICNKCNSDYIIPFKSFAQGHRCPYCSGQKVNETNWAYSNYEMLQSSKDKEILKTITISSSKKNIWICNKCNSEYVSTFNDFKNGIRCPYCCTAPRKVNETNWAYSNEEMRKWVKNPEDLKKYTISSSNKIDWGCIKCNNVWKSTIDNFYSNGNRCPRCNESKGEKKIIEYLDQCQIEHSRQYRIFACKSKRSLPFDHAIIKNEKLIGLIEYQGQQHFKKIKHWGGRKALKAVEERDLIKLNYCKENNIPLLIIPYTETDIEKVLREWLISLGFNITEEKQQ